MCRDVYIVLSCINPENGRDYLKMNRACVESLLSAGVVNDKIISITNDVKECDDLSKKLSIQTKVFDQIPQQYTRFGKRAPKLFFYKCLALSSVLSKPITESSIMCMCDVDTLFLKDPTSYLIKIFESDIDVASQHGYRFLRKSRIKRMKHSHVHPSLINYKELTGYFGSETMAHLYIKYGKNLPLPDTRITSNFVAIRPSVFHDLVMLWRKFCDEIVDKPFVKGDQEILASAIHCMELNYQRFDFSQYIRHLMGCNK